MAAKEEETKSGRKKWIHHYTADHDNTDRLVDSFHPIPSHSDSPDNLLKAANLSALNYSSSEKCAGTIAKLNVEQHLDGQ